MRGMRSTLSAASVATWDLVCQARFRSGSEPRSSDELEKHLGAENVAVEEFINPVFKKARSVNVVGSLRSRIREFLEQGCEPTPRGIQTLFEIVIDEGVPGLRRLGQRDIDLLCGLLQPCAARLVVYASDERPRLLPHDSCFANTFQHLATQRRMFRVLVGSARPVATRAFTFQRFW